MGVMCYTTSPAYTQGGGETSWGQEPRGHLGILPTKVM